MLAAINLKRARAKQPIKKTTDPPEFKVRDLLLLKNHKKQNWNTKYMSNFHICKLLIIGHLTYRTLMVM